MTEDGKFEGWAIVELMGHRRLAGYASEQEIAGHAFLRLDIQTGAGDETTQFYGAQAVYCLTPTTEEIARKIGATCRPAPVHRFELEPLRPPASDSGTWADAVDPEPLDGVL